MTTAETTRGHTYDGIQEFDNRLPNWWLWTFYLACIFSVFYWIAYHTLRTADLPGATYAAEQASEAERLEAEAAKNPVSNEMLLGLAKNPAIVAEGRKIFEDATKCALCHDTNGAASAAGKIGANLTDDYWIYGDSPMDIYTTILKGRAANPEKGLAGGMLPWEAYGPQFVQRATAYVLSIKGSNVQGGKAPETYAKKVQ